MVDNKLNKIEVKINGMTCSSCEVLIERKFKAIPGVEKAKVNHASGKAELFCSKEPNLNELNNAIRENGYSVGHIDKKENNSKGNNVYKIEKKHLETGAIFLLIFGSYLILKQFNLLPKIGISDNMSYGIILLVGVVAAFSTCLAVTGGLLLSITTKYNQLYQNLTGYQKFKPHLYFNIGRIVSYTLLGGLIGLFGSIITPSIRTTGILTIIASVVMIILGLNMLNFSWFARFQPKMPKFIAHKIYEMNPNSKATPFLFGAGTFFFPCGFTQALQLYVLSKASFTVGALTMGVFALGTLPALISLGAVSSFAKGTFLKRFTKFAAVFVILLGIFSINNGLALTGNSIDFGNFIPSAKAQEVNDIKIIDGKQIVELTVRDLDYYPNRFTIIEGVPVEWRIDGREAYGCAQIISVPSLGIIEYLPKDKIKTITFTPKDIGTIRFTCSMGMAGPGFFNVIENTQGIKGEEIAGEKLSQPDSFASGEVQRLNMEISRERGFYPKTFTVKKSIPVELEIDAKVQLGGCMSVLVIPEYDITHRQVLGKSVIKFTPTREGRVPFTCGMGSKMGEFIVTA
ncbi:MAG: sulfite exporter TauE/SafE family protein [Candidatus Woesearchaeota archaeon]|nr:MAG: sulfite exporter TauE/SafE family protein [Candidatus Woesearchaeota archaeon]